MPKALAQHRFQTISPTYPLRLEFLKIARKDKNKTEVTKNQAPWIKKFWPATSYPNGYQDRAPYCAAAACYWLQEWLLNPDVLDAFGFSKAKAEKWRCKSASVFKSPNNNWLDWAIDNSLLILPKNCILKAGDIVIYTYSHLEVVTDDDNTETGPFVAIGANTNESAVRDGEGCFEKPRKRTSVKNFIRLLQ